ncbi:MAG: tetratricopeptide repeat protein [Candidatus Nanoarchaeia archaeon]
MTKKASENIQDNKKEGDNEAENSTDRDTSEINNNFTKTKINKSLWLLSILTILLLVVLAVMFSNSALFSSTKRGWNHLEEGNFEMAASEFQKSLEDDPSHLDYSGMGTLLLNSGQFSEAKSAFERSIEIESTAGALRGLGWAQFYLGNFSASIAALEESLEHETKATALRGLGWANLEVGNYNSALELFENSLELETHLLAYEGKGVARLEQGDYNNALKFFNKALEHYNSTSTSTIGRGIVYRNLEEYKNATSEFERGIEIFNNSAFKGRTDYLMLGKALFYTQNYNTSKDVFTRVENTYGRTNETLAWIIRNEMQLKDYEGVENLLQQKSHKINLSGYSWVDYESWMGDYREEGGPSSHTAEWVNAPANFTYDEEEYTKLVGEGWETYSGVNVSKNNVSFRDFNRTLELFSKANEINPYGVEPYRGYLFVCFVSDMLNKNKTLKYARMLSELEPNAFNDDTNHIIGWAFIEHKEWELAAKHFNAINLTKEDYSDAKEWLEDYSS